MALQNIAEHKLFAEHFSFDDETMQSVTLQSMHYLHRYYALYSADEFDDCAVSQGLLQVTILGFAFKAKFQDFVLEHIPIHEQLALFDVEVPQVVNCPSHLTTPQNSASGQEG